MLLGALNINCKAHRQPLWKKSGEQAVNNKQKEPARVDTARIDKTSSLMYPKVSRFLLFLQPLIPLPSFSQAGGLDTGHGSQQVQGCATNLIVSVSCST